MTRERHRICIVTPGQLGSNPRVVKEATTLSNAGHDVTVIATKVSDFVEPRDQAIIARANFKIERIPFDRTLSWRGERMLQVAAQNSFVERTLPNSADYAYSAFTRRLTKAAISVPADLYIAHYVAALPAAARAAKKHGARFAFDAEDYHMGDLPDQTEYDAQRQQIKHIEQTYLKNAAYVTAASPGIASAYQAQYAIPLPKVVLNTFPKADADFVCAIEPLTSPSAYWFSQTIGPDRGLETALQAIAQASVQPHLHLRGTPAQGYEHVLRELADRLNVSDRLHIYAPEPAHKMVALAAQHDVGLVLETGHTENRKIALTNKQFTYMLAGIPSILSDIPAHQAFAEQAPGASFLFRTEDATDLARAFDALLSDTNELRASRESAKTLAHDTFNWETQEPILLDCIAEAVGGLTA
ncbi:MAG: glycosyltransferase [Pseudomonadota bacterium]